jgi:hypothetical protein
LVSVLYVNFFESVFGLFVVGFDFQKLSLIFLSLRLVSLVLSFKPGIFLNENFVFFSDLLHDELTEITTELCRRATFVKFNIFLDFISELEFERFILIGDFFELFFQHGELFVNILKAVLKVLNFFFIGIEQRDEGSLKIVQDRMISNGIVQVRVLLTRLNVKLNMQVPKLLSETFSCE